MKRARPNEVSDGLDQQSLAAAGGAGAGAQISDGFPCVRLRGLPFDVMEGDIKMFLELETVDIVMVKRDGRFSGEALVVLGSLQLVEAALSKHRQFIGQRFIEIFPSSKRDYYRAVAAYVSGDSYGQQGMGMGRGGMGAGSGGTTWLKLRGLPFAAVPDDIIAFFDDGTLGIPRLDPSRVHMWTDGGRPTGMALVQFNTPQEASIARSKDKGLMGTRYVEIFPATRGDLDKFMARTGEQIAV
ncbi:hypothetical protein VOLCADRAFT_84201 [Volvox carteri f. nagariensis]|uniref:RRM domain-containing protein n=1 Tax=Volvox carteri f. nagariensis TaxID=3068 RepID=D8UGH4_VOLCA|nr:uncharacterized protein VOLCADRAFT_84201 [Volvox carteri f. nagariensis]EFJ41175.1 hypothetical protein VOLCADRAFT_84201 [Volvox carteri f. nagariensis]|eukprot:XP_002957743.1 hypothetical protein VOLCADRAFT_84201 [Volvox carteri f. nagariensis]